MDLYIKLDRMREQRRVKVELNIREKAVQDLLHQQFEFDLKTHSQGSNNNNTVQ